jgi:hypothetical protein
MNIITTFGIDPFPIKQHDTIVILFSYSNNPIKIYMLIAYYDLNLDINYPDIIFYPDDTEPSYILIKNMIDSKDPKLALLNCKHDYDSIRYVSQAILNNQIYTYYIYKEDNQNIKRDIETYQWLCSHPVVKILGGIKAALQEHNQPYLPRPPAWRHTTRGSWPWEWLSK